MIKKPWVPKVEIKKQPRFKQVPDCKYKNILGDSNEWYFAKLKQRSSNDQQPHHRYMDDDADTCRKEVREHITALIANEIEVGKIGAVITTDEDADGFYLVEWTELPYTCQDTGDLKCRGNYLNRVGRTRKWYTKSDLDDEHLVRHVVMGEVKMEPISNTNQLPSTCNRPEAIRMKAVKISKESDYFIFDETKRRDQLEDPMYERYDGDEDSDGSDSDGSDSDDSTP